jgi:NADPH2 dehydrogenase
MKHFTYRTLDELTHAAETLPAPHVRFEPDPAKVQALLTRPVTIGEVTVGNSMAVHPMEGCDGTPDGRPDELTWRRYERFARGGAKLVWFEATAIRPDGRANTRQLWIHPGNVSDFARMRESIDRWHGEAWGNSADLLVPIQLTMSGRYSTPTKSIAYHNPLIDRKTNTPPDYPVVTDAEIEQIEDDFVAAARLVTEAGFTAVDIKVTHGYLLSELLGATTRDGRYGGSLENRTRAIRNILGKLRATFGKSLMLCMRLGCFDGIPYRPDPVTGIGVPFEFETPYPYGFGVNRANPLEPDLTEVRLAIASFREAGLDLVNVSMGCPYYNPHVGRPFEKPDDGNYEPPEHPLAGVDRHFRVAGELQHSFPDLPLVGTGYSWLQKYCVNAGAANIAAGNIRFLGIGRGTLAYPDFARDVIEKGELDERRVCKTLTYCTYLMRNKLSPLGQFPTGCPPFDKQGYGQIMKQAREAQRLAAPRK